MVSIYIYMYKCMFQLAQDYLRVQTEIALLTQRRYVFQLTLHSYETVEYL